MSPSPESNRPPALTGRVRRQLRLRGKRRRRPTRRPPACRRATRGLPARRSLAVESKWHPVFTLENGQPREVAVTIRARGGNRTRVSSLEGWGLHHSATRANSFGRAPSGSRTRSSDLASQRAAGNTLGANVDLESRAGVEPAHHRVAAGGLSTLATSTEGDPGPGLGSPPHTRTRTPREEASRVAEESNLADRFWRPARSQIATQRGGRRDSNPLGTRSQRAGSTLRPRPQCARSESNRARPLIERLHDPRATGTCWSRWLELPQRPPVPETGAHLTELHPERCPRLGSNQHLPVFGRAPSPDRLRGRLGGRGGARPQASSTIRLSKSVRNCSGTRIRTSICRVKACRPAISRSPSGPVPGPGLEPGFLRSERRGLPLADPGEEGRGPPGTRTPLSRVRAECFAIKACSPDLREVPPVGLEPTQAGLKDRCPSRWATAANDSRRRICEGGSGRTRTCALAFARTDLQSASFAARMHAPPKRSRDSHSVPWMTSRNEKSRRGFPGRPYSSYLR